MVTGRVVTLSKSVLLHAVRLSLCGVKVRGRDAHVWGLQKTGS